MARLASEGQKEEVRKQLKAQRKEKLMLAQTGKDLKKLFEKSWILKRMLTGAENAGILEDTILKKKRAVFLKFLESEEQCHKWYGDLPQYYFVELSKRFKTDHTNGLDWMSSEYEKLQTGICDLSAQNKDGHPQIFLDARENCSEKIEPEVIVID